MHKSLFYIVFLFSMSSCLKPDKAVQLPAKGALEESIINLGSTYDAQVYLNLSTGEQFVSDGRKYDLALEADSNSNHIYLNSGNIALLYASGDTSFASADTIGSGNWNPDVSSLNSDSLAIGNWWTTREIFIIDRGKNHFSGNDRFKKIRFISASQTAYTVEYCDYNQNIPSRFVVKKNNNYSLMYFSFDGSGKMVEQAPIKTKWDMVFTRFTHIYADQPYTSTFRNYAVTGVLLNIWAKTKGQIIKDVSSPNKNFDEADAVFAAQKTMSTDADIIGFDWKFYDFNANRYVIRAPQYYLILDQNGWYHKIKFTDFYDNNGVKGSIHFQHQKI